MTPRTLKSAIENDYLISNILYKGSKQCRVDVRPRFYRGGKAIIPSGFRLLMLSVFTLILTKDFNPISSREVLAGCPQHVAGGF